MTSVNPVSGSAPPSSTDPALKKVAEQFEAIFVRQMMGSMRQAKLVDDPLDSSATDNFRELADARTADSIASGGHLGLAAMIERQLASKAGGAK
jgi:flagellar protein FlgJ